MTRDQQVADRRFQVQNSETKDSLVNPSTGNINTVVKLHKREEPENHF